LAPGLAPVAPLARRRVTYDTRDQRAFATRLGGTCLTPASGLVSVLTCGEADNTTGESQQAKTSTSRVMMYSALELIFTNPGILNDK
jgi:hypothetical protein